MSYGLIYIYTAWADRCQFTIVYKRKETANMLYVIPVSSIRGLLPLPVVPVGKAGTILFDMRRESADFLSAVCDKTKDISDGCRWWYVRQQLGPGMGNQTIVAINNEIPERTYYEFINNM
jgi:hypothetical protein